MSFRPQTLEKRKATHAHLFGRKFGRLTPIGVVALKRRTGVVCSCSCGARYVTLAWILSTGAAKSCGCLRRESTIRRSTKHGGRGLPEYTIWQGMLQRCYDPNADNYKYYGGLGVTVSARWRSDFGAFLLDMGKRPSPQHSIDRKNPFGNYCKSNCRWVTKSQQSTNTRRRYVQTHGEG